MDIMVASRFIVKSGTIDYITNESSTDKKKREMYLFNDSLLIAKTDGEKLKLFKMIPFDQFLIKDIPDTPSNVYLL